MSRIRWYHVCVVLGLFDVFVILLSLQVHSGTMKDSERLIEKARRHDEQSKWLQRAEERVVRLSGPGDDLFQGKDLETCATMLGIEKTKLLEIMDEGRGLQGLGPLPDEELDQMFSAADELFREFENQLVHHPDRKPEPTIAAAGALARMDGAQHDALRKLGLIQSMNDALRDELLQTHQRDLERRARDERFVIAAVIVVLVGIFAFGRRLYVAERTLQEERRRLEEVRRERLAAIGELCSSVAHGIRNPLAGIRSSAQLTLQLGQLDPASRTRLQDVIEEGRRLGDRVTGLLTLAKATADKFSSVSLSKVITSASNGMSAELANRGIQLDLAIPHHDVFVRGNQHQLEQIVIELLSNAMDHSQFGDQISVSCERPNANGSVEIAVQDQGPGVSDELKANLFDLFLTTKPGGTGIGLATARRYARLHGGDVTIATSTTGARFIVSLPVAMGEQGEESGAADDN